MNKLIAILFLSALGGCATVDSANYQNVEFDKDGRVAQIDFRREGLPAEDVSIEQCVQRHIANEDIDIRDRSRALGFLILIPAVGIFIEDDHKVVEASDLILESSPSKVKVAGRIRQSEESLNPQTLGFLLTISEAKHETLYRYESPQIMLDVQIEAFMPDEANGWIPLTSGTMLGFFQEQYSLLEQRTTVLHACIIESV